MRRDLLLDRIKTQRRITTTNRPTSWFVARQECMPTAAIYWIASIAAAAHFPKAAYQLATCACMRCYVRRRAAQDHTPDTHKCMPVSLRATHHMHATATRANNNWKHTPHQLPHACTTIDTAA